MDELEISGKRYISSRRAGKEHKYHPDYIGQLVRAGKVDGQKVGRAWYVDADSLAQYLSKDLSKESISPVLAEKVTEEIIEEIKIAPEEVPIEIQPELVSEQIPEPVHVSVRKEVVPEVVERNIITTSRKIEEDKIIPVHISKQRTGGLTYMTDDEPLFPAIKKGAIPMTTTPPQFERVSARNEVRETLISREMIKPKKTSKGNTFARLGFVVLLGAISFGLTLGASYMLGGVLNFEGTNFTAGVSFFSAQ